MLGSYMEALNLPAFLEAYIVNGKNTALICLCYECSTASVCGTE